MHSESAREQLHAKWLPSGTNSLPSGLCQLSQVLKDARVIMCGQWKPLATSRAGPSQSRCSLGAGVLCQIMCRLNPEYIIIKIKIKKQTKKKWPLPTQPSAQGCSCDHMWPVEALGHLTCWPKSAQVQPWCWCAMQDLVQSQPNCSAQSWSSLGTGVLSQIMCKLNPDY